MVQAFPVDSHSIAKTQRSRMNANFSIGQEFKESEEDAKQEALQSQDNKCPDLCTNSKDRVMPTDDSIREEITLNSSTDNTKALETSENGQILSSDQKSITKNSEIFMSGSTDEHTRKRFSKVRKSSKLDSNLEVFGAFCSTSLPNTYSKQ